MQRWSDLGVIAQGSLVVLIAQGSLVVLIAQGALVVFIAQGFLVVLIAQDLLVVRMNHKTRPMDNTAELVAGMYVFGLTNFIKLDSHSGS